MRYFRFGSGPPLVLLHGLLGYSFSWRFVLPALSSHRTLYAVDTLGAGFSERPPGLDCSLRASAERLWRFLDALALEQCDLLGSSHGGGVVLMAAALHPRRVRRMVLAAPVNPWSEHGKRISRWLSHPFLAPLVGHGLPLLGFVHDRLLRRLYGDTARIPPGTLQGYRAPLLTPGGFEHALSILRSWNPSLQDLQAMLPQIGPVPTLLIWGTRDGAVSPASAAHLEKALADCRTLLLPGVGHLPYEETPEIFNQALVQFLLAEPTPR